MNGELKDQATGLDGNPYNPNDLGTSMIAFRHMGGNLGMTNDWKMCIRDRVYMVQSLKAETKLS